MKLASIRHDVDGAFDSLARRRQFARFEIEAPQSVQRIRIIRILPQYRFERGAGGIAVAPKVGGHGGPTAHRRAKRVVEAAARPFGAQQRLVGDMSFGVPVVTDGGARRADSRPIVEGRHGHHDEVVVLGDLGQEVTILTHAQPLVEATPQRDDAPIDERRRPIEERAAEHQRPIERNAECANHGTVRRQHP